MGRIMNYALILLGIVLTASPAFPRADSLGLVWPPPPDSPRIRHLQTISSFEEMESGKGFFEKIAGFLFGGNDDQQWLIQPVGIAIGPDGRLFIADPGAHGIHIIDLVEKEYTFVGQTEYGPLQSPVGIAVAPDGTFYISDSERNDIIAMKDEHEALFRIRTHLDRPTGLSVSGGKLHVIDTGRHAVVVFNLKGSYLFEFGHRGAGGGEFNYPVNVTVRDSIFVVDALNYRIQRFDSAGTFGSVFGILGDVAGRFSSPKAVALDSDGDMYVTDALMDNIQIFDRAGKLLLIVGQKGSRDGEFLSPSGIAIDSNDRIHVVDALNRRIQIFQYLK
jgi:DNA-binding beta-propeller fold protein YncE